MRPVLRVPLLLLAACTAVGLAACEAREVTGVGQPIGVFPGQAFAFRFGGVQSDEGVQSVRAADGSLVTVGTFTGTVDFDPSSRVDTRVSQGLTDFFITRVDSTGALRWATTIGGPGADVARSVAVAEDGRVVVVGSGTSGFQCVGGVVQGAFTSSRDLVMAVLGADGRCERLLILGGGGTDEARAVALAPGNEIYLTGVYQGTVDFDPTAGEFLLQPRTPGDPGDVFVARYSLDGALRWAIPVGGRGNDQAWALQFDAAQGVVIAGGFTDTVDVDPGASARLLGSLGQGDVFVASYDPQGQFRWGDRLGGTGTDLVAPHALSLTTSRDVLVGGQFSGTMILGNGLGVVPVVSFGAADGYVVRFGAAGVPLNGFAIGGPGDDNVTGLVATGSDVVVAGGFQGRVDFSRGVLTRVLIAQSPAAGQGSDHFLARYDLTGQLRFAQWLRPTSAPTQRVTGHLAGGDATVWLTGRFSGVINADPGTGFATLTSAGFSDVVLARYGVEDGAVVRR